MGGVCGDCGIGDFGGLANAKTKHECPADIRVFGDCWQDLGGLRLGVEVPGIYIYIYIYKAKDLRA
jgi:hypothetical protein